MTDEPMSDQPSCSEAAFEQEARSIERTALVRFAYHLWQVDTAARSFPHHLPDQMEIMRARWYIGLILEVVSMSIDVDTQLILFVDKFSLRDRRCLHARLHVLQSQHGHEPKVAMASNRYLLFPTRDPLGFPSPQQSRTPSGSMPSLGVWFPSNLSSGADALVGESRY